MTYMPPLPQITPLPEDRLRKWLINQTLPFNKIVTGELQVGQELASSGFVAGSSGWQIDGEGNAEFNDVTIRGDIVSSNWDETIPANLASPDSGATAGYYLDSSTGSAQISGNLWVTGNFRSYNPGDTYYLSIAPEDVGSWDGGTLSWRYTSDNSRIFEIYAALTAGNDRFVIDGPATQFKMDDNGFSLIADASYFTITDPTNTSDLMWVDYADGIRTNDTTGSAEVLGGLFTFKGDQNTYMYRSGADQLAFATGGTLAAHFNSFGHLFMASANNFYADAGAVGDPGISFSGDTDTGIYNPGANQIAIGVGGTVKFFIGSDTRIQGINDTTTGAAANVFINSTTGLMARSTSSLKYKKDWQFADMDALADLALPTPIVWTETRAEKSDSIPERVFQDIYLGFGTEHVEKMLPAAVQDRNEKGEPDNYDPRALIAVLVAKIARLERLAGVSA